MKSVRVATLEVSEGEECGVPFFTLHRLDPGRGSSYTFHGCDRRLIISRTRD